MESSYYHQTSEYQSTRGQFLEESIQPKSSHRETGQGQNNTVYENAETVSKNIQQIKILQEKLIRENNASLIEEQIKLIGTLLNIKRSELPYNAGSSTQSTPNNGSSQNNFIQLVSSPQRQVRSLQISVTNETQILQNTIDQLQAENIRLNQLLQANEEQWTQKFKQKYLMAYQSLELLENQIKDQQSSHRKTISDLQRQLADQTSDTIPIKMELLKNENIDLRRKDNENVTFINLQKDQIQQLNQRISQLERAVKEPNKIINNQQEKSVNQEIELLKTENFDLRRKDNENVIFIKLQKEDIQQLNQRIALLEKAMKEPHKTIDDVQERQLKNQIQSKDDELLKLKEQIKKFDQYQQQQQKQALEWQNEEKQYQQEICSLEKEIQSLKIQTNKVNLNDQKQFEEQILSKTQSIQVQNLQSIIASQDQQIKNLEEQILKTNLFPSLGLSSIKLEQENNQNNLPQQSDAKDKKIKQLHAIIELMDHELQIFQGKQV